MADNFNVTLDELYGRKISKFPWEDDDTLRAVVFIGHRMVKKEEMDDKLREKCSEITIEYDGNVQDVESYFNVECENVEGNVTAGGDVECEEIEGNIIAGGNVKYEEKDEDDD